jgi:hypothetical protein
MADNPRLLRHDAISKAKFIELNTRGVKAESDRLEQIQRHFADLPFADAYRVATFCRRALNGNAGKLSSHDHRHIPTILAYAATLEPQDEDAILIRLPKAAQAHPTEV